MFNDHSPMHDSMQQAPDPLERDLNNQGVNAPTSPAPRVPDPPAPPSAPAHFRGIPAPAGRRTPPNTWSTSCSVSPSPESALYSNRKPFRQRAVKAQLLAQAPVGGLLRVFPGPRMVAAGVGPQVGK